MACNNTLSTRPRSQQSQIGLAASCPHRGFPRSVGKMTCEQWAAQIVPHGARLRTLCLPQCDELRPGRSFCGATRGFRWERLRRRGIRRQRRPSLHHPLKCKYMHVHSRTMPLRCPDDAILSHHTVLMFLSVHPDERLSLAGLYPSCLSRAGSTCRWAIMRICSAIKERRCSYGPISP